MLRIGTQVLTGLGLVLLLSGCVLLDAINPCPPPRAADALEPNDTRATSTRLAQKLEADLNPKETDVYNFEALAAQQYTFEAWILEDNGNDDSGLNLLIEGPNNFRLEKLRPFDVLEFTTPNTATYYLTVTDGSKKYADCFRCTCTGRGPKYSLELKVVP